jgi:hypothetical protein
MAAEKKVSKNRKARKTTGGKKVVKAQSVDSVEDPRFPVVGLGASHPEVTLPTHIPTPSG